MYLFLSHSQPGRTVTNVCISTNYTLKHLISNHQGLMISASVDVKECVPLVPETRFGGIKKCFETLDGFWNDKSLMLFRFLMLWSRDWICACRIPMKAQQISMEVKDTTFERFFTFPTCCIFVSSLKMSDRLTRLFEHISEILSNWTNNLVCIIFILVLFFLWILSKISVHLNASVLCTSYLWS